MVALTQFIPDSYLLMATSNGEIKKTDASKFAAVRSNGLIAIDLEESDELVAVSLAANEDDIILVTKKGQSIKFKVAELRASSRTSGGVRGMRLASGDRVVSMDVALPDAFLLTITTSGFGKLTPITDYPRQHRGGGGVRTFKVTDKTGEVVAAKQVSKSEEIMMISANGIVIRTPVKEKDTGRGISVQGRSTQGVTLMKPRPGDHVVALASFEQSITMT
jgi:DNA gyrase subunit A